MPESCTGIGLGGKERLVGKEFVVLHSKACTAQLVGATGKVMKILLVKPAASAALREYRVARAPVSSPKSVAWLDIGR
jgi:hypothetical protein